MNKRIKKKLQNRFGYKKYSEYRIQRIYKALKDQIDNDTILYIVTGKRPNNKNFHSIKLLTWVGTLLGYAVHIHWQNSSTVFLLSTNTKD